MGATPPPLQWQGTVLGNITNNDQGGRTVGMGSAAAAHCTEVMRHVKSVAAADARRDADLYDLLANTRREETYQPYFAGWPNLLQPLSPTLHDLPSMVQEKYRTCQTMCFCGLFSEIKCAWASIDNSLYLWRYDRSGDIPVEYCGEEQAICAVGLVKPRPGVFLEAVQHVVVLCTTTEVVLLGVCPTRRAAASFPNLPPTLEQGVQHSHDITLQPLPMYSVPSDNLVITSVASTRGGRIFLGGSDGHLYELKYGAEGWARRRCVKERITGKLQRLLPSFVPALLPAFLPAMLGFGVGQAVEKVVVDNERHILYTLSTPSVIQVFDLGAKGDEPARKVAEITDFYQAAASATGGRDVFRNAAGEKKSAAIKQISPISVAESSKLQLLVVTADGRRVYCTTRHLRAAYYGGYTTAPQQEVENQRPVTLSAIFARQAPPHTSMRGGGDLMRPAPLEVVAAHYAGGALMLAQGTGATSGQSELGPSTQVLLAARNHTVPSSFALSGNGNSTAGLRELLTEVDNLVPGEACAIETIPSHSVLDILAAANPGLRGMQDELSTQIFTEPPRCVLISTAGVMELQRRRPLELLASVLEQHNAVLLRTFFDAFGAAESASMCLALAAARPGTLPAAVAVEAARALDNPALVGEARMPQDAAPSERSQQHPASVVGGIYMGQAVNPNPEPDWSAGHRGLCLYLARVLAPAWDVRLTNTKGVLQCSLSGEVIRVLMDKLGALAIFMDELLARRQERGAGVRYSPVRLGGTLGGGLYGGAGAHTDEAVHAAKRQRLTQAGMLESERGACVRALAGKACQALGLVRLLATNNLGRLAARADAQARRQLGELTLRDLVCEAWGEALATKLISLLVQQQLDAGSGTGAGSSGSVAAGVEAVAAALQRDCPAFFKEEDRVFYQASAKLKSAEAAASSSEKETLVQEAVAQLVRIPLTANLEYLMAQLSFLKAYGAMVDVPLAAAAAVDPANLALQPGTSPEQTEASKARREAYQPVLNVLRQLITGNGNPGAAAAASAGQAADQAQKAPPPQERAAHRATLMKAALAAADTAFHAALFETLIELGEAGALLASGSPYLQTFLIERSGLTGALPAAVAGAELPPVGPLTAQQVSMAELLSKLLVGQRRFKEAASVGQCLAARLPGPGDQACSTKQRVDCLQAAVLQAKSAGESALVERLEADCRLMGYQAQVAERLQAALPSLPPGSPEAAETSRQLGDVSSRPLDVTQLYNDYAQPLKMWDVCLQLVHFAGGSVEPGLVRQLWDHGLLAAWEGQPTQGNQKGLSAAAALVENLGAQFYPNEASFPTTYVAFRLVQIAMGAWPAPSDGSSAAATGPQGTAGGAVGSVVADALAGACGGSAGGAARVLELLLARRGAGIPDHELAPLPVRSALLSCLAVCCARAQEQLGSALVAPGLAPVTGRGQGTATSATRGPSGLGALPLVMAQREAGALVEACDRYALEARRLGTPESESLAEGFGVVKRALQARLNTGSR